MEEKVLVYIRAIDALTGLERSYISLLFPYDYNLQRKKLINKECLFVKEIQLIKNKFTPAY